MRNQIGRCPTVVHKGFVTPEAMSATFSLWKYFHTYMYDLQGFRTESSWITLDVIQAVTWKPHMMQLWLSIAQTDIWIPICKRTNRITNKYLVCSFYSTDNCNKETTSLQKGLRTFFLELVHVALSQSQTKLTLGCLLITWLFLLIQP